MKRKRYTAKKIVASIKQHELSIPVADISRKLRMAGQTFDPWKKQYGGLEVRKLKLLRHENTELKKLVAQLSLDELMLYDIVGKVLSAPQLRAVVGRGCHRVVGQWSGANAYGHQLPVITPGNKLKIDCQLYCHCQCRYKVVAHRVPTQ